MKKIEIHTDFNIANGVNINNRTNSTADYSKNDEKFSSKLENISKNSETSNSKNQSLEKPEKISPREENEDKVRKDSEDRKKVNDLIISLLQGKIDLNEFQEEINNISIEDNQKKLFIDDILKVENKDDSISEVIQLINENGLTSKDKELGSKEKFIQRLQFMVQKFQEGNDDINNDNKYLSKNELIDTLLATRFASTKKSSNESTNTYKKSGPNVDDILNSLIQKKSDRNDTAILKINGLINSIDNNNQSVEEISGQQIVINKNNLVDDIIKSVKFMDSNQIKELTVKINPKELGEVVIKLVVNGNSMKVNIETSNKEAYNLLNSQANELSKNLQDIKIHGVTIDINQADTTFFTGQFNSHSQSGEQKKNKNHTVMTNNLNIDDVENISESLLDSNINALA